MTSLLASFALSKNKQKFRSSELLAGSCLPFQCYLSVSVCCVGVFCLFTPFLLVLSVLDLRNLVLLYLINTDIQLLQVSNIQLLQVSNFWKGNTLWKVNFWYQWIIQGNRDSCREHVTRVGNIYLYGCVSLLSVLCVFVCMCVCYIKLEFQQKSTCVRTQETWHLVA